MMEALSAGGLTARWAPSARRLLAHHGRSFHWASRWLGTRDAERLAVLYAFCRRLDDLVDEKPPGEGRAALEAALRDLTRGGSRDPAIAAFLEVTGDTGMPNCVPSYFLGALAHDLEPVRVPDAASLIRYAYGAAGTVGLMVCAVLGVRDPRALPFAVDLGVAMQLTNIARDVVEDAQRDRLYLPRTFLTPRVTPDALRAGDLAARLDASVAVQRVLDLAERYYRSADRGMRYLPRRARLAILTASRVYEAIGNAVRRDGFWQGRAVVGRPAKMRHTLRAVAVQALRPRFWHVGAKPVHDPALHAPIRGLPGADRGA